MNLVFLTFIAGMVKDLSEVWSVYIFPFYGSLLSELVLCLLSSVSISEISRDQLECMLLKPHWLGPWVLLDGELPGLYYISFYQLLGHGFG